MEYVRLGELCSITSSKRIFAHQYVEQGVPFYRSKEIIEKRENKEISEPLFISQEVFESIKTKYGTPIKDDILLTSVGTLGIPYLVKDETFYFKDGNLTWLKDFKSNVCSNYIYYWLSSSFGKSLLLQRAIGSSQPAITIEILKKYKLVLPSLPTQRKIASILSAYDSLIENNSKRIRLLEQMAENLYKEWFVRFRFPGHQNVKMIDGLPEGWKYEVCSSVTEIMSGGTPKTEIEEYYGGEIPFYTPKDSSDTVFAFDTITKITESGLEHCNSQYYPINTLIITARGTVGKINLIAVPMAMNQSCFALRFKDKANPYFLYYSIKEAVSLLKKMANGGVFDTIILKTFDHLKITIPTKEVLERFEALVSPIMENLKSLQRQISLLTRQRDLLLPRLMSGKLEVKDNSI